MKRKIRRNVFETNSSSTHSICVAKDVELIIPESLHFDFGEFGWENDSLQTVHEKASYLYTGLISNSMEEDALKIFETLKNKNIDVSYEEMSSDSGYVDHSYELQDFLDAICQDENTLMNFLFSPLSFILTGNDNDDTDVDIDVTYSHDEFYKGN